MMMQRRRFLSLAAAGSAAAALPSIAGAQQKPKYPLIGVLNPGSSDTPRIVARRLARVLQG